MTPPAPSVLNQKFDGIERFGVTGRSGGSKLIPR
jgi:hypothetical protein